MFCRRCGNEILDDSIFCAKCGTKIVITENEHQETCNQNENESVTENNLGRDEKNGISNLVSEETKDIVEETVEKNRLEFTLKHKIGMVLGAIFIVILIIVGWQNSLVTTVKRAYDSGDYETAYNKIGSIFNQERIADYQMKIEVMYNVDKPYQEWKEEKYDTGQFSMAEVWTLDTLASCVGYSQMAKESGCDDKVDAIAKEVAQWWANKGVNVESRLKSKYDKTDYAFRPLYYDGDQLVYAEISRICKMISKDEVIRAQNEANPLKIENENAYKDGNYWYCTGTVSNVSTKTHEYVKVRVTYYDANGTVLTTDWGYAVGSEGIRGGENQQFELMTKVDGTPKKYKVEIMEYD